LWLQKFPEIQEFQTTAIGSSLTDLKRFISTFPEAMQEYLTLNIPSRELNGDDFLWIVRRGFRTNPLRTSASALGDTMDCMRLVNDQARLMQSTSMKISNDVRVVATAVYDKRQDSQLQQIHDEAGHSFYYRIMLENHSSDAVQLVGRHWIFKSNGTETEVPKFSRGVIGVEPIIKPGQNFQYMSMANLEADRGVMAGAFLMKTEATGSPFEVEVAPCALDPDVFIA